MVENKRENLIELTDTECEVLRLLVSGYNEKQCAKILGISEQNSIAFCRRLHQKFKASNWGELLSAHNRIAETVDKRLAAIKSNVISHTGGGTWHRQLTGFTQSDLEANVRICEIIHDALSQGLELDDDLMPRPTDDDTRH